MQYPATRETNHLLKLNFQPYSIKEAILLVGSHLQSQSELYRVSDGIKLWTKSRQTGTDGQGAV